MNAQPQRDILSQLLELVTVAENEDVERHLKLAAQKQLDFILGKKKRVRYLDRMFFSGENHRSMPILTTEEVRLGEQKGKLSCVKEYKNRTGYTLMESKRAVEDYFLDNNKFFHTYK